MLIKTVVPGKKERGWCNKSWYSQFCANVRPLAPFPPPSSASVRDSRRRSSFLLYRLPFFLWPFYINNFLSRCLLKKLIFSETCALYSQFVVPSGYVVSLINPQRKYYSSAEVRQHLSTHVICFSLDLEELCRIYFSTCTLKSNVDRNRAVIQCLNHTD